MIIPSKYENLNKNILVIGSEIINLLKKQSFNIENLYQRIKKKKDINFDTFYDTLTFLWLSEIIDKIEFQIYLKK
jgi:Fe2+ or Zn2+ uptake regulation protein